MEGTKAVSSKIITKIIIFILLLLLIINILIIKPKLKLSSEIINNFSTVFLSMILEAIPFIIIGAFISSLIQIFITEDIVYKIIPKNVFLGTITASLVGLVFPVCECAIVPIARSLMKKGVPVSIATTFMLAVPILNPVVLLSTYYAFLGNPYMVVLRAILGMAASIIIGLIIGTLYNKDPIKLQNINHSNDCNCMNCNSSRYNSRNKISKIINSTSYEFYNIGRFFIIGALLSAAMQTFIPRASILSMGQGDLESILIMMSLAFILSICSETDAFIARTFLGQFTMGSIVGFLIFGPMLDAKNTIMLFGNFRKGYVIILTLLIISVCFIMSVLCNTGTLMLMK